MIEHVVHALAPAVDEVIVVRSAEMALPNLPGNARIVADREPARGPLAGIRDALSATDAEAAFVTSTDAPFLTADYVDSLFAFSEGRACAPVEDGFMQVLSAIYPGDARAAAQALLDAGKGRPRALLESLSCRTLDAEADAVSGVEAYAEAAGEGGVDIGRPGRRAWTGFNTPDAYLSCVREVDPEAKATLVLEEESAADRRVRIPVGTLGEFLETGAKALGQSGRGWEAEGALANSIRVRLGDAPDSPDACSLDLPVGPGENVRLSLRPSAREMKAQNGDR